MITVPRNVGVDLYWLPLGAGGHFVRFNGRVYERILAHREHRQCCDLYHTALVVTVSEGRFVIENAWPIPDGHPETRGVTIQGPVWSPALGRLRVFRYEVRRWLNGTIADLEYAVASPQAVSDDEEQARLVLELTERVPVHVWGRVASHAGEMWNSNSVISWLLTMTGIPLETVQPPPGGRAPGWVTGVALAQRDIATERSSHEFAWSRSSSIAL